MIAIKRKNIIYMTLLICVLLLLGYLHITDPCSSRSMPNAAQDKNLVTNTSQDDESDKSGESPLNKGYHLHINLDSLVMYVYKDGQLLCSFPVSGGKKSTPSPIGTWKINNKDTWGSGFGGSWMGLSVPWGTYGIHGTLEPWYVGKSNVSKGCIRMKSKDAEILYKMVPYGTTVTISQASRSFRPVANGDVGSDILMVQKALQKLNYYDAGLDGMFGDILEKSVRKFQVDNNLANTGVITKQTYDLIIKKEQEN